MMFEINRVTDAWRCKGRYTEDFKPYFSYIADAVEATVYSNREAPPNRRGGLLLGGRPGKERQALAHAPKDW
jgi:hypothetical protein